MGDEQYVHSMKTGSALSRGCLHEDRGARAGRYLLQREVGFIRQLLGGVNRRGKLIDVGCGRGCATLPLYDMGLQPLGLDINRLALTAFRQRSKDVPLVQGDALRLPVSSDSVGCLVATHLFDHLDRAQFFRECHRVLCNDGLLIFDALNRHSYKLIVKRLGRFLGPRLTGRPSDKWIDVFSCREVLELIVLVGFDLQTISGYSWIPFSVDSNSRLVNAIASVERFLRLDRLPHVSPRILMAVRKKAED
jgi:SAM-dependent methyltransferase